MAQKELRIALTGGGSGGHVYPLLAAAEALEKLAIDRRISGMKIRYFGPADGYRAAIRNAGIMTSSIVSGKVRRYFSLLNFLDVPKFFIGLIEALFKMFWYMPDAVFSKGGTGALPVVIAAWFYRIPVIIHESDAQPGLNNLISARFSRRVAVCFERAMQYFSAQKTALIGLPIRRSLLDNRPSKEQAKEELGFAPDQPLLLVLGGSQGAQRINELIVLVLKDLIEITQILHQTGAANFHEVERLSRTVLLDVPLKTEVKNRYQAAAYFDQNMKTALAAADLVVARAGSSTIFEIAAFSKPSILLPLRESANDHQRINAYEFAKTGAAIVIEEINLLPNIFLGEVRKVIKNPDMENAMSLAAGNFFRPQAAEVVAEEIVRLAGF